MNFWEKRALVALQGFVVSPLFSTSFLPGPKAAAALQRHTKTDLNQFVFFTGGFVVIDGVECYIQRSGYTGEDGFEVFERFFVHFILPSRFPSPKNLLSRFLRLSSRNLKSSQLDWQCEIPFAWRQVCACTETI